MSNSVDLTKPLLYNGTSVRLVSDNLLGSVLAVLRKVEKADYEEILYLEQDDPLLVNVPPVKISRFMNIYSKNVSTWATLEDAKSVRMERPCLGVLELIIDADTHKLVETVLHKE